ncbi:FAD-dependent oxidoreductase [Kutzneria kofuensis]|uniref:2-polyprenyl-6-methoxyphenol hydroxylase-like FAD-dependent oxidoreductase n=1 Tax=Kutzneria kofuensis TaxID=103725 RepID=A0A7W9KNZ1_9PSEU|nr:FAD-dependent monooxygenase [Kutzneria kofuensis]MBB5895975.1 2-polyprenyl-6-methoxyphenol hydroxylase-like FAD-dependent oxidoreductase [Kutzneria kofuensis]
MSAADVFNRLSDPNPPTDTPVLFGRAVVMGGSVAGLMAARVLADHAEQVIVVERDDPGTSTAPRPGVPQSSQIHALLPSGLIQLERFFPGFTEQAVAAGARPQPPSTIRRYVDGQLRASDFDTAMLGGSRPFIEARIREHTLARPNVKTIVGRATGVEFDGEAATGVRVEADGAETVERADFVVDAMGRSSRLSDWLEQAGWQRPPMQRMTVDLNYACAVFRRDDEPDHTIVLSVRSPQLSPDVSGAAVCQIEENRWLVLVAGYAEHRPAQTTEDLIRFCRTELSDEFVHAVANEVVDDVRTYRHPDSRRRDFHRLRRMPARLVAVGDAVASFNPIYGQGMTSGTLHASCLSDFLRSRPDLSRPARGFFALQKVVVDAAWSTSTGADLQLPHVDGPYPRFYRIRRWLDNQVAAATLHDAAMNRLFDEVTFMLRHPRELTRPSVRLRAILLNRRAKKG